MTRKFALTQNADHRRVLAQAVMLAMGVVGVAANTASAQTLYGGGATLPAVGYVGPTAALGGSTDTRLTNPVTETTSLFGAYASAHSESVSYCQTGSGTGKKVLGQWTSFAANNTCGLFSGTPFGFSGAAALPNFAASDAPLAQSEYSSVITNVGVAPAQFPSVAGAIGIIYNNTSVSSLNLTDSQVCEIFSGVITNWSQISSASGAITVAYRTDGSGTSFSLSNHLSHVCTSAAEFKSSGEFFTTDQTFTNVVAHSGGLPSGAVGASGNPGVVNEVSATTNSIGYGEIADALNHDPVLQYATVNSEDPVANFGATFTITTTTGQVIAGVNTIGQATLGAITGGSNTSCVVVAIPSSYAVPSSGYPIVAVSNLLGYYSGNGATNAPLIQDLLSAPYTTSIKRAATDIGSGKGLAWVSDSSGNATTANVDLCIND